jgi:hypothetical protein
MADDIAAKLQKENAEKFKKTINEFHESVVLSDIASEELKQGSQALQDMKGVWKDEVAAPMKGMVTGFTSMIPGFGLASKMTMLAAKTGFSHFFGAKKLQKQQEKQMLQALGITKGEMKRHQQQQAKIKAEQSVMDNLQKAADEWGLIADDFDAKAEAQKGADADRDHLNKTEQKLVDQQILLLDLQSKHQESVQSKHEQQQSATEQLVEGVTAAMAGGEGGEGGAAAKEEKNEQRRTDEKLIGTLEGIEKNTAGGAGVKPQSSMGAGDAGKFAGIGGKIGGIGKGLGKGLGGILKGISSGLVSFANPLVPVGAIALGAAITAVGAGIAGAMWITGKALPTFKDGLKSFEDLDGDALVSAGKGMAAVAGGMAAFGVGTAVAGLGSLIGGITTGIVSLFGGDDPLTKMEKFQAYNFDEKKITSNAASMVAYGKGMAALGGAQAVAGLGAVVGAVGGAIAGLFGAENPLDKMLKFQAYAFDTEKIKTNAAAVKAYADAIKDFPTAPSASVFTAAKDAIIGLLGGKTDPFAPMVKFGALELNEAGIKTNAGAVKAYAEAVKDFPSSPSASVFTAAKEAIIGLLGGNVDPFAPMKLFGDLVLNTEGIKTNALAVKAYADAVKDFPSSPAASVFTAAKEAIINLLGGKTDPFAPMKAFGDLVLNTEQIKTNAGAVKAYAEAMQGFPESPAPGVMSAAAGAIVDLLGGDTNPFTPMKKFGEVKLDVEQIKLNASAMVAYSTAMENMPAAPVAGVMTAAKNAVIDLLGGDTDPFAPMKKFGDLVLNKEQIISNAGAVKAYGEVIKDMPAAPETSILTAAKDAIVGLLGGKTDPFAPMKAFGELKLDAAQIAINAKAVSAFGAAMSTVPEIKAERSGGLLGSIASFFGGEKKMPWDQVKAFADADMGDAAKLKSNAESLTAFGKSLAGLSAIPTDIEARLKGLGNGLEEFADYINDGEIKTVTQFAEAMSKFPIGTFTGKISGPDTTMAGKDFDKNTVRMTAANVVIDTTGGGGSVTNVISAPNINQATANTKVEAAIGVMDPFTNAARAY